MKIVDITEKLSFNQNPVVRIKGMKIEVNSDATTVLKIMGLFGDPEKSEAESSLEAYNLLFNEKEKKKIERLKLKFGDFMILIESAMNLVVNTDENKGE